ncbi:hypothetical protein LIER_08546 [Lithospermum erythrorhizon]|uniref:Uncharacterized protein n=1 Tax=Lithospermum erythrorhizon TaxID=34254 RepID=A0AAV3PGB9_LITER
MVVPPKQAPTHSPISNIKNLLSMVLDFSNYDIWKVVIIPVFESHGVLQYIDGSSSSPPSFISTNTGKLVSSRSYLEWKKVDAMVLSWIQATISVHILPSLLQHGDHLSMLDYITQMKSLADSLLAIEAVIIEKDLVGQLCIGLPEDYISIITSITTRVPFPSCMEARSLLLNFEAQLKSFFTASHQSSPALLLASKHPAGSSSGHRGRGRSRHNQAYRHGKPRYYFGQMQPYSSVSASWKAPSLLGPPQASQNLICQYCNRPNHTAKTCPQLTSNAFYAATPSGSSPASMQSFVPFDDQWHFDTGATSHMTSNSVMLMSFRPHMANDKVLIGDSSSIPITHSGDSMISSQSKPLTLPNVLVVPNLPTNLLFGKATNQTWISCASPGPLPSSYVSFSSLESPVLALTANVVSSSQLWHMRLGHPASSAFHSLSQSSSIPIKSLLDIYQTCHACQLGKLMRRPHAPNEKRASSAFELIHNDIWTSPIVSPSGFKYYIVF